MSPMMAAAATSNGLLTFQRNKTTRLTSATSAVSQSPMAIRPRRTEAPRMVPMAARTRLDEPLDVRVRAITHEDWCHDQNEQEGRQEMPMVATTEPQKPATR